MASLLGLTAVAAGAFGAHGLGARLSPRLLDTFEIAVRYHFYHALALLAAVPILDRVSRTAARWVPRCWIGGVLIFSGSLYLLSITGAGWLGAITPIGGLALIAGWALLAWGFLAAEAGRV